jgi:hypothetical protein
VGDRRTLIDVTWSNGKDLASATTNNESTSGNVKREEGLSRLTRVVYAKFVSIYWLDAIDASYELAAKMERGAFGLSSNEMWYVCWIAVMFLLQT